MVKVVVVVTVTMDNEDGGDSDDEVDGEGDSDDEGGGDDYIFLTLPVACRETSKSLGSISGDGILYPYQGLDNDDILLLLEYAVPSSPLLLQKRQRLTHIWYRRIKASMYIITLVCQQKNGKRLKITGG